MGVPGILDVSLGREYKIMVKASEYNTMTKYKNTKTHDQDEMHMTMHQNTRP